MAIRQSDLILRHIRKLAGAETDAAVSDRELLSRFALRHDERAFETLVGRHGPMVFRVSNRLLANAQDAEDVFQATFLVLARQAGARRWRDSVANWLYEVAHHLALNVRMAAARRRARDKRARPHFPGDPLTEITGRELLAALDEELARLPEKLRAPLVLCCLEGNTRDEAAKQLGCPLGTLKSRLESGRERLRKRLTRRGLTLSSALLATLLTETVSPAAAPAALVQGTVQTALGLLGAQGAAAITSAPAVVLAQTWLRGMFMTKVKLALMVFGLSTAGRHRPVGLPGRYAGGQTDNHQRRAKTGTENRKGAESGRAKAGAPRPLRRPAA
jgi:RNA polymerase sigma factor (sigma-70 family)